MNTYKVVVHSESVEMGPATWFADLHVEGNEGSELIGDVEFNPWSDTTLSEAFTAIVEMVIDHQAYTRRVENADPGDEQDENTGMVDGGITARVELVEAPEDDNDRTSD